jgi:hypothetical protein
VLAVAVASSGSLAALLPAAPPAGALSSALMSWSQLSPPSSPSARQQATLVFDPASAQFLLFGGAASGGELNDTWSWSGSGWSQVDDSGDAGCTSACTQSPPPRALAASAYDPASGQLVVFGGLTNGPSNNVLDDTWAWSSASWAQLDDGADPGCTTSCTQSPPARESGALSFDPNTGQLLLFGGLSASGAALNDTWAWNGSTWSQIADSGDAGCTTGCTASPPARSGAAADFDLSTGQLVLLGGLSASAAALNDTWALSSSGWSQIDDSGDAGCTSACSASPSARSGASLGFDGASGQFLLFGGNGASLDADTWVLVPPAPTSAGWAQVNATASPPARNVSMQAYDPATGQFVLFGGNTASTALNDTWIWTGTTWTQVDDTGDPGCTSTCTNSPPKRYTAAMAYDPATSQLILFGGQEGGTYGNDTWAWNGTTWTQVDDAGAAGCVSTCPSSPPIRQGPMLAWDPASAQMLLFGGFISYPSPLNDTWTWNGSTWTQVDDAGDPGCTNACTSSPPARQAGGMAFDQATGQLLLFGGANATTSLNDTWLWSGTTWSQADDSSDPGCTSSCTNSPLGRDRVLLVDDPVTATFVVFGGIGSSTYDDTWSWNGSSWTEVGFDGSCTATCPQSPPARQAEWGDFDPGTGQLIEFGGGNGGTYFGDTWAWDLVPLVLASPTVQLSASLNGYDQTVTATSTVEIANEGGTGWLLSVKTDGSPGWSGHSLPLPSINGSAVSASSSAAPSQACIGTCVLAGGNAATYPLTVPVSSSGATLYTAAAGTGIGDLTITLDWWETVPGGAYAPSVGSSYGTHPTFTLSYGP